LDQTIAGNHGYSAKSGLLRRNKHKNRLAALLLNSFDKMIATKQKQEKVIDIYQSVSAIHPMLRRRGDIRQVDIAEGDFTLTFFCPRS
jgi:hypothetical protein